MSLFGTRPRSERGGGALACASHNPHLPLAHTGGFGETQGLVGPFGLDFPVPYGDREAGFLPLGEPPSVGMKKPTE
jgi:hypothetical protein